MAMGRVAQKVRGTFVKVLTDPVSGKIFVQKFGEITKIVIYYLLITESWTPFLL
jgi:hypothetical protein